MAEQTTRPIEFADRIIETVKPNEGQVAVLVRMGFWRRNYGEEIDPSSPQFAKQLSALNRLMTLIAALFAKQEDWDWIEDQMAEGTMDPKEVLPLLVAILRVWNDEEMPTNRAGRRTAAKKTTAKRVQQLPPVDGRT